MADGRKATTGQPSGATTTAARLARKRASWPPSPSSFSALSCTVHDRVAIVTKAVAENTSAASNLAGYPSEFSLMDALARYAHTARTLRERERERNPVAKTRARSRYRHGERRGENALFRPSYYFSLYYRTENYRIVPSLLAIQLPVRLDRKE